MKTNSYLAAHGYAKLARVELEIHREPVGFDRDDNIIEQICGETIWLVTVDGAVYADQPQVGETGAERADYYRARGHLDDRACYFGPAPKAEPQYRYQVVDSDGWELATFDTKQEARDALRALKAQEPAHYRHAIVWEVAIR